MVPGLSIGEPPVMGPIGIVKDGLTTHDPLTSSPSRQRSMTPSSVKEVRKPLSVFGVPPIGVLRKLFRNGNFVRYGTDLLRDSFTR